MLPILTPSAAYGCIELIQYLSKGQITRWQAIELQFGPIPTKLLIDYVLIIDWIKLDEDGVLSLLKRGLNCLEIDPAIGKLRFLLGDFIRSCRSPWVQLIRQGRSAFLLQAPPEIIQLLHEAKLASTSDDDTVQFWDNLSLFVLTSRDEKLLLIGRSGEKLSMAYEHERVGVKPKWVALESDSFGYDILSRSSVDDPSLLKIEVKCSEARVSNADFFITKHEWETAKHSSKYLLHLWALGGNKKELAICSIDQLEGHIPINNGLGYWEVTKIPFTAVAERFGQLER
jgi:hypothetical protein